MRHFVFASGAADYLLFTAPAWANYIDVTYSGTVGQVAASNVPAGITVGTPITFNVVFDTAKIVDYTASVDAAIPAVAAFSSVRTASLSDDPLASLTIAIGSITFTKFDGVGNIFINSQGYTLDVDPIADAIQRATPRRAAGGHQHHQRPGERGAGARQLAPAARRRDYVARLSQMQGTRRTRRFG